MAHVIHGGDPGSFGIMGVRANPIPGRPPMPSVLQSPQLHVQVEEVTREDFPLPTLGPKLEAIHKDLIFGDCQNRKDKLSCMHTLDMTAPWLPCMAHLHASPDRLPYNPSL